MPVNPTYPGLYIEELPSSTHTITAAPTSVTVFIGYPHPLKTPTVNFRKPIELFSFTDYETNFGGFFQSDVFAYDQSQGCFGDLANAVNQFFLNGGGIAWVVGLPPSLQPNKTLGNLTAIPITGATLTLGPVTFMATEITDANHQMQVTFSNPTTVQSSVPASSSVSQPTDTLVDVLITYGPTLAAIQANITVQSITESYRQVSLFTQYINNNLNQLNPNYLFYKLGASSLVTVSPPPSNVLYPPLPPMGMTLFPMSLPLPSGLLLSPPIVLPGVPPVPANAPTAAPPEGGLIFNTGDFTAVLQADTALDKLSIFNLMVIPGVSDFAVLEAAVGFCERKLAFLIMDPPINASADGTVPPNSTLIQDDFNGVGDTPISNSSPNSALYFPYLQSSDPQSGQTIYIPPSATVAGIFASTDTSRGVWKAPAGLATTLTNIIDVVPSGQMTDSRQGVLNQLGINCIRKFPSIPPVVWGARTSVAFNTAFAQWKYVPVRRMALFLEQTLYLNLGWVVFEPNAEPLWTAIVTSIQAFMLGLYRQGAFQGTTPSQAFQVKCDSSTTTQTDIDNGVVNIVVAFAPLKPAEFVIIQIAQLAGQTQTS